jgi:hypothetical protein
MQKNAIVASVISHFTPETVESYLPPPKNIEQNILEYVDSKKGIFILS